MAKQHLKIRRQRRAVHFTTAKHAAEWYRRIGVDDGNVCQRVQHHQLATSRHDASGSAFLAILAILTQQAERAGHGVIRVPASPRPRALHQPDMQSVQGIRAEESERAHPSLSRVWLDRRS